MMRDRAAALRHRAVAALFAAVALASAARSDEAPPPEPRDYRTEAYRAPVPETLAGATVVDADAAQALWEAGGTLFVDVLPRPPKPADLPEGTIWREKPRNSIPGAIWLPNVGYGALADVTDAWFRERLALATDGERDRPVLFFCLAECWMSWNAAKRAASEYGYANVYWFPGGTDDWANALLPLEPVTPEPGEPVARR